MRRGEVDGGGFEEAVVVVVVVVVVMVVVMKRDMMYCCMGAHGWAVVIKTGPGSRVMGSDWLRRRPGFFVNREKE